MAGTNSHYTIREARAILAQHGMTIKSVEGDYIVGFKSGSRETYTATNLLDAIGTGIDMAEKASFKLVVGGEVVADEKEALALAANIFLTSGVVVAIEYACGR